MRQLTRTPPPSPLRPPLRTPPWVAMGSVLAFALLFRYAGLFAADRLQSGESALGQVIFFGVAMLAAGAAAVVGRVWSTPTGAVVMGVLGGLAATRFEDSLPGAAVGLLVGLAVATTAAWKLSRHLAATAITFGFGAVVGGGALACLRTGTALGLARAGGIVVAAGLLRAAFRSPPSSNFESPESSSRWSRWRGRLVLAAGAAAGALWLSEPLARWAT